MNNHRKIVIPGERLFKLGPEYVSGSGTYVTHNYVYSSLTGFLHLKQSDKDPNVQIVEVIRNLQTKHSVPFVGAIVTCKVMQATSRYAKCAILCVEDCTLSHSFSGLIRKEDIREFEKDTADVFKCFKTSDIVLARVISLGDMQSCLLSTAEDALGVVSGRCQESHKMIVSNFNELHCEICEISENRKIAKVPHVVPSKN